MESQRDAVVGEVCLYGSSRDNGGYGYIARAGDGKMFGDGEPNPNLGLNSAMWLGALDLADAGHKGIVAVFAPGGQRVAYMDNRNPKYYGDLAWERAPVYVLSMADVIAASEEPR
jgi:hypothetical protein